MPIHERNRSVLVESHEKREPLTTSSSVLTCQHGITSSRTFHTGSSSVSPRKESNLVSTSQRMQQATQSTTRKSRRKSPAFSLNNFLASSSERTTDGVKSANGACGQSSYQKSSVKAVRRSPQKYASTCKRNQKSLLALSNEHGTNSSPPSMIPRQGSRGAIDPEAPLLPRSYPLQAQQGSMPCCEEHVVKTPPARKPAHTTNAETTDSQVREKRTPPDSKIQLLSPPALANQSSMDCLPIKPARSPSKGSKTQNAVFRPKTPQKRFIKKGIKLSSAIIMSSKMKALAGSPKATLNPFVDIASPGSVNDGKDSSDRKPSDVTHSTRMTDYNNDSSSSLQISDISDPPTRVMQLSLPDLLGRSVDNKTRHEGSLSDLFDCEDDQPEKIRTVDAHTSLCHDRWHCSTPCLSSPDLSLKQASRQHLLLSRTNIETFESSQRTGSSSELFMPNKPRRYRSRECF